MNEAATLSVTGNERIVPGGNQPPAIEAHKANIDDLFDEAQTWLNGDGVNSAGEADAVETLLDMARQAKKAADEARAAEKAPHLEAGRAVDAAWQPLVKRADMIVDTCRKALTPWKTKVAAEKAAIAEQARREAEEVQRQAQEAIRASAGDIAAREDAEHMLNSAKIADKDAKRAEKAATTGTGLRTTYRAEIADFGVAARHYWQSHHARFEALVLDIAQEEVRAGKRDIPGITVITEQKAI